MSMDSMPSMTTAPPTDTMAPGTTAPAGSAPGTAGGELPMEVTVDINDFAYGPTEVRVAVGGTVTFVNNDAQAHTATVSGGFDTGSIASGASASVTLDEAGTLQYFCAFHPFMTGTVIVG